LGLRTKEFIDFIFDFAVIGTRKEELVSTLLPKARYFNGFFGEVVQVMREAVRFERISPVDE
jgi:hypothetical protein